MLPFRLHDIIIIYELLLPLQDAIIDRSNPTRTRRGRELEEIAHPRKSCRSLDLSGLVHSYFVTRLFPGSSAWSATHHNKVWPSALDPQPRPRPRPRPPRVGVGVGVEVEVSLSEAPPLRLPLRRRHRLLPPPGADSALEAPPFRLRQRLQQLLPSAWGAGSVLGAPLLRPRRPRRHRFLPPPRVGLALGLPQLQRLLPPQGPAVVNRQCSQKSPRRRWRFPRTQLLSIT